MFECVCVCVCVCIFVQLAGGCHCLVALCWICLIPRCVRTQMTGCLCACAVLAETVRSRYSHDGRASLPSLNNDHITNDIQPTTPGDMRLPSLSSSVPLDTEFFPLYIASPADSQTNTGTHTYTLAAYTQSLHFTYMQENIRRNFGMPQPNGYRKALRFMRHADKFGLPIVTFVDTPGAYAGKAAEELGQVCVSVSVCVLCQCQVEAEKQTEMRRRGHANVGV